MYFNLGYLIGSRKIFIWSVSVVFGTDALVYLIILIVMAVSFHHHPCYPQGSYTLALHKALMFFNTQQCELIFQQCELVFLLKFPSWLDLAPQNHILMQSGLFQSIPMYRGGVTPG